MNGQSGWWTTGKQKNLFSLFLLCFRVLPKEKGFFWGGFLIYLLWAYYYIVSSLNCLSDRARATRRDRPLCHTVKRTVEALWACQLRGLTKTTKIPTTVWEKTTVSETSALTSAGLHSPHISSSSSLFLRATYRTCFLLLSQLKGAWEATRS